MRLFFSAAPLTLGLTLLASQIMAAPAAPAIRFDVNLVTVTGFHAGRTLVLVGVGTAPGPYFLRLLRYTQTLVTDDKGSATYKLADGVPTRSIWFAVDRQTRDYIASSPLDAAPRASLTPPTALTGLHGASDAINLDLGLAEVLIVRPGSGVWTGSCGRNSKKDINRGKSGEMRLSLDNVVAMTKDGGATKVLLPSDLIIVVDSETLAYYAGTIGKS